MKKKISKKLVPIVIAIVILFLFSGCGNELKDEGSTNTIESTIIGSDVFLDCEKICLLENRGIAYTYPYAKPEEGIFYEIGYDDTVTLVKIPLEKFERVTELESGLNNDFFIITHLLGEVLVNYYNQENQKQFTHELDLSEDERLSSVRQDKNGNIFILIKRKTDSEILVLNQTGNEIKRINALEYPMLSLKNTANMEVCLVGAEADQGIKYFYQCIDDLSLSEKKYFPQNFISNIEGIIDGKNFDLYFLDNNSTICGFDIRTQKETPLLTLIDQRETLTEMIKIMAEKNNEFYIQNQEYGGNGYPSGQSLYKLMGNQTQSMREKLVLVTFSLDGSVEEAIFNFNQQNASYYIEIKEYSNNEKDRKQFIIDLIAGESMDIIHLDDYIYDTLVQKNMLADMSVYLKTSKLEQQVNKNILEILEEDNKILRFPLDYNICGLITNMETGQNLENTCIVAESKEEILSKLVANNYDELLNCNRKDKFDEQLFLQMINYSQEQEDKNIEFKDSYGVLECLQEATGNILCTTEQDFLLADIEQYKHYLGDELEIIPYPFKNEDELGFSTYLMYGIMEQSKNKETAWKFIEMQLEKEYQMTHQTNFPMNTLAFNAMLKMYTTRDAYMDDLQRFIEPVSGSIEVNGVIYELEPLSDTNAELIRHSIDKINYYVPHSNEVMKIISDEMEEQDKNKIAIEETISRIKSRVELFLAE